MNGELSSVHARSVRKREYLSSVNTSARRHFAESSLLRVSANKTTELNWLALAFLFVDKAVVVGVENNQFAELRYFLCFNIDIFIEK